MIDHLNRIRFNVPDMDKAKKWYTAVLEQEPIVDHHLQVVFNAGNSWLTIRSGNPSQANSSLSPAEYWLVDDIDGMFEKLLKSGAKVHSEFSVTPFGEKAVSVRDPFGNIFGIMENKIYKEGRLVESKPSRTAMGAAFFRAIAAIEEDKAIGPDYLAALFLSKEMKIILEYPEMRKWAKKYRAPSGLYEYMCARTMSFDRYYNEALKDGCTQIVILGAGYDTRSCRFRDRTGKARIFELDIPTTQERKKEVLSQANISVPDQVLFVPINFNRDSLEDVLFNAGFDKNQKTFFLWEGVTYYLAPQTVDHTLKFVQSHSSKSSSIAFDYVAISESLLDGYGVKDLIGYMQSENPGEPSRFAIEECRIESFLSERGFQVLHHQTAKELEQKMIKTDNGFSGKITAFFCVVHASGGCPFV
ncbi:MAG: SAM-dependent methyltransferase [Proteobacteria bacterium]|nr:SAM-dependent methyltransferase [Pseudomonadota bacterium]